jgi:hypothetical protein
MTEKLLVVDKRSTTYTGNVHFAQLHRLLRHSIESHHFEITHISNSLALTPDSLDREVSLTCVKEVAPFREGVVQITLSLSDAVPITISDDAVGVSGYKGTVTISASAKILSERISIEKKKQFSFFMRTLFKRLIWNSSSKKELDLVQKLVNECIDSSRLYCVRNDHATYMINGGQS